MNRNEPERRKRARSSPRRGDSRGSPFQAPRDRDRKTRQLCKQVERAVYFALAEFEDPIFDRLEVESVRAEPGESRLCVSLVVDPHGEEIELDELCARLAAVRPCIRSQVAAAIHRRRAPVLDLLVRRGVGEERDG